MELRIDLKYNQLLKLVRQLPYKEKEKLNREIEKDLKTRGKKSPNDFQTFLLQGPLMSDEQFNNYTELRKEFTRWIEK